MVWSDDGCSSGVAVSEDMLALIKRTYSHCFRHKISTLGAVAFPAHAKQWVLMRELLGMFL